MRYFTIYMTNGGRLSVRQNRERARAFESFANVAGGSHNNDKTPPIWAVLLEVSPKAHRSGVLKVHGECI